MSITLLPEKTQLGKFSVEQIKNLKQEFNDAPVGGCQVEVISNMIKTAFGKAVKMKIELQGDSYMIDIDKAFLKHEEGNVSVIYDNRSTYYYNFGLITELFFIVLDSLTLHTQCNYTIIE